MGGGGVGGGGVGTVNVVGVYIVHGVDVHGDVHMGMYTWGAQPCMYTHTGSHATALFSMTPFYQLIHCDHK